MNGSLSLSNGSGFCKNVIIFRVDNSSSRHKNDRRKDILILGKGLTGGLDDTTMTAKAEYCINFSEQQNKFCLGLHYNGSSSHLFTSSIKLYQFIRKNSKIKPYESCLGNISQSITWKRLGSISSFTIFLLTTIILILTILQTFTHFWWKNTIMNKCLDSLSHSLLFWCWYCYVYGLLTAARTI